MNGIRAFAWIALVAMGASAARHKDAPTGSPPPSYRNDTIGFSLVPPTFKVPAEQGVTPVASFSAPIDNGFSANINIQVHRVAFDEFLKATEAQFSSPGIEVVSKKDLKVGTHTAAEWVYKATMQTYHLTLIGLAVDKGDCVLLVTATSLEQSFVQNEPWMRNALSSIKLDS